MKYYLVCNTPRSGTHLIKALMRAVDAGYPTEHFYYLIDAFEGKTERLCEYPQRMYKIGERGGVWGSCVHYYHFHRGLDLLRTVCGLGHLNDLQTLEELFPNLYFIHLYRLDKIKHVISWWKSLNGGTATYNSDVLDVNIDDCDTNVIERLIIRMVKYESRWNDFFESNNICPLRIAYEDLCSDKVSTISRILGFLEIEKPDDLALKIKNAELPIRQYNKTSEILYRKCLKG